MTRQLWYVYYRRMFFKHINPSQVPMMAGAVVGACRANGWALDVQPKLLGAIFSALFNFDEDFRTLPAATIDAVAATFPNAEERREIVDLMLTCELCLHEIPAQLSSSIDRWAARLGVSTIDLTVARELAQGAQARAQFDLYRNGFWGACTEIDPAFSALIEANGARAFAPDDHRRSVRERPLGSPGTVSTRKPRARCLGLLSGTQLHLSGRPWRRQQGRVAS